MGVDLIGVRLSYNWNGWHTLYDLGVAFGWRPAGTLLPEETAEPYQFSYPPDDDPGPRGGYFSNDFHWVTDADAAAWARAIHRAIDVMAGTAVAGTEQEAEALRRLQAKNEDGDKQIEALTRDQPKVKAALDALAFPGSTEDWLRQFVDAAARRGFMIS
jgi:hypothetical protein